MKKLKIQDFLKNDVRQIVREPLMLMLLIMPLILVVALFLIKMFVWGWLDGLVEIDLGQYVGYIDVMAIMTQSLLIGSVLGFLMLDEKDAKILQLLVVTPIGFLGYLIRRSILPILSNLFSVIITFLALQVKLSIIAYIVVLIFCISESLMIGFLLMSFAEDKIKGLTLVKGMGVLFVFGFAELIPIRMIQWLGKIVPYYWNAQVILHDELWMMGVGLLLHTILLLLIVRRLKVMIC